MQKWQKQNFRMGADRIESWYIKGGLGLRVEMNQHQRKLLLSSVTWALVFLLFQSQSMVCCFFRIHSSMAPAKNAEIQAHACCEKARIAKIPSSFELSYSSVVTKSQCKGPSFFQNMLVKTMEPLGSLEMTSFIPSLITLPERYPVILPVFSGAPPGLGLPRFLVLKRLLV